MTDYTREISSSIELSISIKNRLLYDKLIIEQVSRLISKVVTSLRAGGKIIFAGNGGSFADAQHLAGEFVSRFRFDRAPLPGLALGTNNSNVTAIGNDYGYNEIFLRELKALGRKGDVFVPISTSGNSPNIISAAEWGQKNGMIVVGMTGESGGSLKGICDCVCIPSNDTPRIQEAHILVGHILCELVERDLFS